MKKTILILAVMLGLQTTANADRNSLLTYLNIDLEKIMVEDRVFNQANDLASNQEVTVASIKVIQLEEEVALGFDPKEYLPKDFNALEGKNDLDWNTIEIIELEEEVDLGFNPKDYLPKDFNPYKGMACVQYASAD